MYLLLHDHFSTLQGSQDDESERMRLMFLEVIFAYLSQKLELLYRKSKKGDGHGREGGEGA